MIKDIMSNQIKKNGIEFKYFVTIPYRFKQRNMDQVRSDNKELRRSLRSFYGYPIKVWFFCEVHTDPDSRHFGGFHRHLLIEDCPPDRWRNPSKRMERFLAEKDPEALFNALSGAPVKDEQKVSLLKRVLRLSQSVPNGLLGVDVKPITDLDGVLGYCLKQVDRQQSVADVIDETNSDIDLDTYWKDWNDLSKQRTRQAVLFA